MPLVVTTEPTTTWATRDEARNPKLWADAPTDDETLDVLLAAATQAVTAYAPALPAGGAVPESYMLATIYQARELQAAALRDGDVIGVGDYAIRARDLTPTVRQLLRPRRGLPGVG